MKHQSVLPYKNNTLAGWQHIIRMTRRTRVREHSKSMGDVVNNAQEVLATANTVFPFNIFPDTITLDRLKLTVTRRVFFKMSDTVSIQIEDLLNVGCAMGPLYGSLKLWTRFYQDDPYTIDHLSRRSVRELKSILQGYMIARQKNIDCSNIAKDDLLPMLRRLGTEQ